jgi:hypothetical protein
MFMSVYHRHCIYPSVAQFYSTLLRIYMENISSNRRE